MHSHISLDEKRRRQVILHDIETRIREDGPRQARPYLDRARQFMPFAALRGYSQMVLQAEQDLAAQEKPVMEPEDLWYLSGEL